MPDAKAGLRERKKQRTREAIIDHALALFAQRGFDATTVSDIAEAADIAPRTFFGYFATKEDVVFHDFETSLAEFAQRLAARPAGETAFDALRAWVVQRMQTTPLDSEAERTRRRLVRDTPSLRAHDRANMARLESVFAGAVARDLGVGPDSLRAHLVSAAAVAALDALSRYEREEPAAEEPGSVLDEALLFLGGGLEALQRHPA